ncbi:hypothetical protein KZZ52_51510 [Dactylosporangium sp. AC04546]|uniref:hypothetical protein n=1 Tax=Dactylosporangium sp. AC04546 TaxID=2862460 RepID=UPI001EDED601|nr:hypothetical protein [Dactylosporangium sp. AC04546]WVK82289.1 hypothetical protein KZZ52_51510 [Dactylosporangium sp. AC04546]
MAEAPKPTVDRDAVRAHVDAALTRGTRVALWTAIADIPILLAEIERQASLLTNARTEFANLLAAANATLTAAHDGDPDPLTYLREEVRR